MLLSALLALLLGACSVASNSQLSPDREPDSPRYASPSDTLALPPDTVQRQ